MICNLWNIIRWTIGILIAVYFGAVLLLFLFQSYLIYFPMRTIEATPHDIGLSYEDASFKTPDGFSLHGWYMPVRDSKAVVLFFHGNACNISQRLETMHILHNLGFSVFIFDYRGYGRSEGRPCEKGTYIDAESALGWLEKRLAVKSLDIIYHGRSLGGPIAAWLAVHHTPKALILESTFTSIPDIASELHPYLPVRLLSRFNYPTAAYIRQVKCPVLIIHSPKDDLIPYSHGRRLFEAANEPKQFLEIIGNHNEGFLISGKSYSEGIAGFVAGLDGKRTP